MDLSEIEVALQAFENLLSEIPVGVKHAVALVNGLTVIKQAVANTKTKETKNGQD